jgi:hypothetical protein
MSNTSLPNSRNLGTLFDAQVQLIGTLIARDGVVALSDGTYRSWSYQFGLTRAESKRALDVLSSKGSIDIRGEGGCLLVRWIGASV